MAYKDLHEFIARLEREGELKRIPVEADVDLEITEITDRVSKASGPVELSKQWLKPLGMLEQDRNPWR